MLSVFYIYPQMVTLNVFLSLQNQIFIGNIHLYLPPTRVAAAVCHCIDSAAMHGKFTFIFEGKIRMSFNRHIERGWHVNLSFSIIIVWKKYKKIYVTGLPIFLYHLKYYEKIDDTTLKWTLWKDLVLMASRLHVSLFREKKIGKRALR